MQLQLLTFGVTKEIVGSTLLKIDVPKQTTVRELHAILCHQYPDFAKLASLMIAVNNEYAQADQILYANDEIALIPPVSGG